VISTSSDVLIVDGGNPGEELKEKNSQQQLIREEEGLRSSNEERGGTQHLRKENARFRRAGKKELLV